MKIGKQLPALASVNPQDRRQALVSDAPAASARRAPAGRETAPEGGKKSASFSLQLNQQLTSMQSAASYLDDLHARLSDLKLNLGRELTSPQKVAGNQLDPLLGEVRQLLDERAARSANSLDAGMRLRLHEPVRSRVRLPGLESLDAIRASGKETLLFTAGRQLAEPVAVVLDDQLSDEQLLRRFNTTLGQAGLRAELERGGALVFTARESDWARLDGQLAVQGEGKLFPRARTPVEADQEKLLHLPDTLAGEHLRDLRRVLDGVVAALDKVGALREQLAHRQAEIREFLARQSHADEREWALDYAHSVFDLMNRSPSSFAAVTQTVVAQATLSRSTVVSLLS
ncbi:hypothetical protein JQR85_18075 [Stutzerimonas urumqiensis]|uniref:hypothetical protein n=1 Tax=Stutzerimonas urumqiensis TaxID=638269 RepID=UPI003DA5FBF5